MPLARSSAAATRLLLVVALAVLALLLAPVAEVAGDAAATSSRAGSAAQVGAGGDRVEAVSAQRRAKKARKAQKVRKARATVAAAASRTPAWTTATLTYYDGLPEEWAWSLRTAVAQWNAAGVGITLRPVSDPVTAQVRVSYGDIGGSSGLATVGATSRAFVKLSDRYRTAIGDEYDRVEVMGVLTHELGHVLGLEHVTTRCALMGPVMDIVGCGIFDVERPEAYRCDVVGQAALEQAARLYGGAPRPLSAGSCTVGA